MSGRIRHLGTFNVSFDHLITQRLVIFVPTFCALPLWLSTHLIQWSTGFLIQRRNQLGLSMTDAQSQNQFHHSWFLVFRIHWSICCSSRWPHKTRITSTIICRLPHYYYNGITVHYTTLPSSKIDLHCPRSCDLRHQFLTPIFFISSSTDLATST